LTRIFTVKVVDIAVFFINRFFRLCPFFDAVVHEVIGVRSSEKS
jgi:hypothetical protein